MILMAQHILISRKFDRNIAKFLLGLNSLTKKPWARITHLHNRVRCYGRNEKTRRYKQKEKEEALQLCSRVYA